MVKSLIDNICLAMLQFKNQCGSVQGRSQDFSNGGGGGHTGSNNIVMTFSPRYIVGCLLKKRLTTGGSRKPQDPPTAKSGKAPTHVHIMNGKVKVKTYFYFYFSSQGYFSKSFLSKLMIPARRNDFTCTINIMEEAVSMGLTVKRQMAKNLTANLQKGNIFTVNRQRYPPLRSSCLGKLNSQNDNNLRV